MSLFGSKKRLIIGDVHAEYDALMRLLDRVPGVANAELYFVGDLIDRGAKSKEVVEWVREHAAGVVLGNHEWMCIEHVERRRSLWLENGGGETLKSYGGKVPTDVLTWFKGLPIAIDLGDVLISHAPAIPEAQGTKQIEVILSNRESPVPQSGKLQVFGHLTLDKPQSFTIGNQTYGVCVDTRRAKRLTGLLLPSLAFVHVDY